MLHKLKKSFTRARLVRGMQELQPLPLGMKAFEEWSDRIIDKAMIGADRDSQKFALADMILHLNATEDHKEDGYFVKVLRKVAVNQVADAKRKLIKETFEARAKTAVSGPDQQQGEVKPIEGNTSLADVEHSKV